MSIWVRILRLPATECACNLNERRSLGCGEDAGRHRVKSKLNPGVPGGRGRAAAGLAEEALESPFGAATPGARPFPPAPGLGTGSAAHLPGKQADLPWCQQTGPPDRLSLRVIFRGLKAAGKGRKKTESPPISDLTEQGTFLILRESKSKPILARDQRKRPSSKDFFS